MPIGDNQCNSNSRMVIKEVITILKPILVTFLAGSKPPNPHEIGQIPLMLNPVRWQHNSSRPGLKVANSNNDSINSNFSNSNINRKWLGRKKKVQLSVLPDVKLGLNLAFFMAALLSRELLVARVPAGRREVVAAASFITMDRPVQPLD